MDSDDTGSCLYTRYVNLDTNFIRLYFKLTETINVELIHDIRVSIKKLRTYFKMMDRVFAGFNYEKNYKPFKRIFLSAGVLRTNHIFQEILAQAEEKLNVTFEIHKENLKAEEQRILTDFKKLMENVDIYDCLKVRGKIRRITSQSIDIERIIGFVEMLIQEILFISENHTMNPHYLHELRKLFKELDYITGWMNKCLEEPVMEKSLYEQIHGFQDTMGLWHDAYDSLMYFQSLNLSGKPEFRSESFIRLIQHVIGVESEKYNCLIAELSELKEKLRNP